MRAAIKVDPSSSGKDSVLPPGVDQNERDLSLERQYGDWVAAVTGLKLDYPGDLMESLKSGILLCQLINKIQPGLISKYNNRRIPLLEMENISLYLKACWELGVPSQYLFVTSDLYLKKGWAKVIQNLQAVSRVAQNCPTFLGPRLGVAVQKGTTLRSDLLKEIPSTYFSESAAQVELEREQAFFKKENNEDINENAKVKEKLEEEIKYRKSLEKEIAELREKLREEKAKADDLENEFGAQRKQWDTEREALQQEINMYRDAKAAEKKENASAEGSQETEEAFKCLKEELEKEKKEKMNLISENSALKEKNGMIQKELDEMKEIMGLILKAEEEEGEEIWISTDEPEQVKEVPKEDVSPPEVTDEVEEENEENDWKKRIEKKEAEEWDEWRQIELEEEQSKSTTIEIQIDDEGEEDYSEEEKEVLEVWEVLLENEKTRREKAEREKKSQAKEVTDASDVAEEDNTSNESAKLEGRIESLKTERQELTSSQNSDADVQDYWKKQNGVKPDDRGDVWRREEGAKNLRELGKGRKTFIGEVRQIGRTRDQSRRRGSTSVRVKSIAVHSGRDNAIDNSLIARLNSCAAKVLYNSNQVEFKHIVELNEAFSHDYGRRQFAFVIKQLIDKVPTLCLSTYAFDMMLYLMHRVLYAMDEAQTRDYISVGIIKDAASRLYRDEDGLFYYIKDFVRDFSVWKDMHFWEESFWDELTTKVKSSEQISASSDRFTEQTQSMLHKFVQDMLDWAVPIDFVRTFTKCMGQRNSLSDNALQMLMQSVASFEKSRRRDKILQPRIAMCSSSSTLEWKKTTSLQKKGSHDGASLTLTQSMSTSCSRKKQKERLPDAQHHQHDKKVKDTDENSISLGSSRSKISGWSVPLRSL